MGSSSLPWKPLLFGSVRKHRRLHSPIYASAQLAELISFEIMHAHRRGTTVSLLIFDTRRAVVSGKEKRRIVASLLESARTTDHLGYYDGEKVAVLLPDTNSEGAEQFLRKLRAKTTPMVTVHSYTYPDRWSEELQGFPEFQISRHRGSAVG